MLAEHLSKDAVLALTVVAAAELSKDLMVKHFIYWTAIAVEMSKDPMVKEPAVWTGMNLFANRQTD